MRRSPWSEPLIAVVAAITLSTSIGKPEDKTYKSKDGSRVVITNKLKDEGTPESVVAIYARDDRKMCALDFSSADGEHGFGVAKAAWTPDEKYFVFSLTSSGGHQAWHAPTLFYSLRDKEIHILDSYISAAGISTGSFILKSPNIVLTEVWRAERQESAPAEFRLDSLMERKRRSHRALQCADGRAYQGDPYGLQTHD